MDDVTHRAAAAAASSPSSPSSWWQITSKQWFEQPQHLLDYICIHAAQLLFESKPYDDNMYNRYRTVEEGNRVVLSDRLIVDMARSSKGTQLDRLNQSFTDIVQLKQICRQYGWCIITPVTKRDRNGRGKSRARSTTSTQHVDIKNCWLIHERHAANILKHNKRTLRNIVRLTGMRYGSEQRIIVQLLSQWVAFQIRSFNAMIAKSVVRYMRDHPTAETNLILKQAQRYSPDSDAGRILGTFLRRVNDVNQLQTYLPWWISMFHVGRDWPPSIARAVINMIMQS